MPVRSTTRTVAASAAAQGIPELPRIGSQLLDVPGMLEYDQNLQDWWDRFKRSALISEASTSETIRKVEKTSESSIGAFSARLTVEETVRASADSALSSRATTLEAQVQTAGTGLLARVTTIESAYVTAAGAYAQAISAIGVQLTGPSGTIYGAVQTEASARATADGLIHARWGVAINVNGRIIGRVNLNGTNQSSAFEVEASNFKLVTNYGDILFDPSSSYLKLGAWAAGDTFTGPNVYLGVPNSSYVALALNGPSQNLAILSADYNTGHGGRLRLFNNVGSATNIDLRGEAGSVTALSFSGSGASLTGLSASNISSGTLNNSRLPSAISVTSLATSNFEASVTTAVDVKGVNLRVYNGATQNARIDYTTGRYYVQGNAVLNTRYGSTPTDEGSIIACLQHHGLCP